MRKINNYLPNQVCSIAEKNKEDWYTESADFFISQANFGFVTDLYNPEEYYQMYEGIASTDAYERLAKPYNEYKVSKRVKDLFANFDIITPIVRSYTGEGLIHSSEFNVAVVNPLSEITKKEVIAAKMYEMADQFMYESLQAKQNNFQPPAAPDFQAAQNELELTVGDEQAILGQELLKIKTEHYNERALETQLKLDAVICGKACAYVGVENNDVVNERVYIPNFYCELAEGSPRFEDGVYCVYRRYMTVQEILVKYYDDLTAKDIKVLQEASEHDNVMAWRFTTEAERFKRALRITGKQTKVTTLERLPVYHVCWLTNVPQKVVTYLAVDMQPVKRLVEADYKKQPGDIEVKNIVGTIVWQTTRIGEAGSELYLRHGMFPVQSSELSNLNQCKLPYYGRGDMQSLYHVGSVYQAQHNILMYKYLLELDKINNFVVLPTILKPASIHWTDWLQTVREQGIWHVEWNPALRDAVNDIRAVNSQVGDTLEQIIQAINFNIQTWYRTISWSDVAAGNPDQYMGKYVTGVAIDNTRKTMLIDALAFYFLQREQRLAFLETAKVGWAETGLIKDVYTDDNRGIKKVYYEQNVHLRSNYIISIINPIQEQEKIRLLTQHLQVLINSGNNTPLVMEIVEALGSGGNMAMIKKVSLKLYKDQMEQQAQQQQAQQQMQERALQTQRELKEREYQNMLDIQYSKERAAKDVANIQADAERDKAEVSRTTSEERSDALLEVARLRNRPNPTKK